MTFVPKLDDGWVCSEYIPYRYVSADLSIVKQHTYIKGNVILQSYDYALNSFPADQVKAAGKAASWKFDWKYETNKHHVYFITYYKSEDSDDVLACIDCGCLPQLMIDKKTGKYYCTCPSSFLGVEDDKIPEIGEPDENGYVLIHKDKSTFDTIEEAIEAWNNEQRFQKTYQKLAEEYCSKNGEMNLEEIINFITKYAADDGNVYRTANVMARMIGYDLNHDEIFLELDNYEYQSKIPFNKGIVGELAGILKKHLEEELIKYKRKESK